MFKSRLIAMCKWGYTFAFIIWYEVSYSFNVALLSFPYQFAVPDAPKLIEVIPYYADDGNFTRVVTSFYAMVFNIIC